MSNLRIAAQQALEALDWYAECAMVSAKAADAASALRAALEQTEQEVKGCDHCNHPLYAAIKCRVCGRVTEQEQEPVAWMVYTQDGKSVCVTDNPADFIEWRSFPLYTHPPRREWRGLDRDETMHLMNDTAENYWADEAHIQRFSRAIEAALKERNA